jgi:hypothetical protein
MSTNPPPVPRRAVYSQRSRRFAFVCHAAAGGCGRSWSGGSPGPKPYPFPHHPMPERRAALRRRRTHVLRVTVAGASAAMAVSAGRAGGLAAAAPSPLPGEPLRRRGRCPRSANGAGGRRGNSGPRRTPGRGSPAGALRISGGGKPPRRRRRCDWVAGPLVAGAFSHPLGGAGGGAPPAGSPSSRLRGWGVGRAVVRPPEPHPAPCSPGFGRRRSATLVAIMARARSSMTTTRAGKVLRGPSD